MPKHDYLKYFPFSKIRSEQKKAIEFAVDAFESGKRYVMPIFITDEKENASRFIHPETI